MRNLGRPNNKKLGYIDAEMSKYVNKEGGQSIKCFLGKNTPNICNGTYDGRKEFKNLTWNREILRRTKVRLVISKAKELLKRMEDDGCLPNSVTYSVIIQEVLKENELREVEIVLEETIDQGALPDYTTFLMLLGVITIFEGDSSMRTVIQKLLSVERKDGSLTSRSVS
ncbi:putative tetratricopeptide-like helical domain-containing protein [Tanacetum coccineum]